MDIASLGAVVLVIVGVQRVKRHSNHISIRVILAVEWLWQVTQDALLKIPKCRRVVVSNSAGCEKAEQTDHQQHGDGENRFCKPTATCGTGVRHWSTPPCELASSM